MRSRRSSSSSAPRLSTARRSQRSSPAAPSSAGRSQAKSKISPTPQYAAATSAGATVAVGGDVHDVERRAQAFEADAGLGERRRHAGGGELGDPCAPALDLGGGKRALDERRARRGSARPSARADRCSDRWRAASGRRARRAGDQRVEKARLARGPRLAGARGERARVGQRLDHDERAHHLGGASRRSRASCG